MPSIYIIIGVSVTLLVLGFTSGYKTKTLFVNAQHSKVLKAERVKLQESIASNKQLLGKLSEKELEVKINTRVITREVIKYVPTIQKTDSQCNITVQSKRLLNNLINPMPTTSTGTIDSNREPSDIRTSDLIANLSLNIEQYKLMQVRCNSLIQWHKSNN